MTRHESQRGYFAYELYEQMKKNDKIYLLTGDLGYIMFDEIKKEFPDRFINCGAAEQAMVGIAVGLALEGKIPFVYTITPFFLRAAETIGLYLNGEHIPVRLVGSGRDDDYAHDGPSHNAVLAQNFLHSLQVVNIYPDSPEQVTEAVQEMIENNYPSFLSLKR